MIILLELGGNFGFFKISFGVLFSIFLNLKYQFFLSYGILLVKVNVIGVQKFRGVKDEVFSQRMFS